MIYYELAVFLEAEPGESADQARLGCSGCTDVYHAVITDILGPQPLGSTEGDEDDPFPRYDLKTMVSLAVEHVGDKGEGHRMRLTRTVTEDLLGTDQIRGYIETHHLEEQERVTGRQRMFVQRNSGQPGR